MVYRAVGNRCAVNLAVLGLPLTLEEILARLQARHFQMVPIDLVGLARAQVGKVYRRGARLAEAPEVFDCSSLIKWLYGQRGIWLPRRSIQQRECGQVVEWGNFVAGDVIFTTGCRNYYHTDPSDGVGHVGLATGEGTIIHAANKRLGVIESPTEKFTTREDFRGARRMIPLGQEVITLELPLNREVETSDDLRWILLQTCTH